MIRYCRSSTATIPSHWTAWAKLYLEPGWSRADRIAGDEGVLEVADDLLNVKRPGEELFGVPAAGAGQ